MCQTFCPFNKFCQIVLCKPTYNEHASDFVRLCKSKLTCVLLVVVCIATKINIIRVYSALSVSEKL
jgi:hypothetical protein